MPCGFSLTGLFGRIADAMASPRGILGGRPLQASSLLTRRRVLGTGLAAAGIAFIRPAPAISFAPRSVSLYNTHTGEWVRTVYWADGQYIRDAVRDINWVLRDHHSNEVRPMNAGVLDLLGMLRRRLEIEPAVPGHLGLSLADDKPPHVFARRRGGQQQLSYSRHGDRFAGRGPGSDASPRRGAQPAMRRGRVLSALRLCPRRLRAGAHLVVGRGRRAEFGVRASERKFP